MISRYLLLLANFLLLLSTQNPQKGLGTSGYFMSTEGCLDSGRNLKLTWILVGNNKVQLCYRAYSDSHNL